MDRRSFCSSIAYAVVFPASIFVQRGGQAGPPPAAKAAAPIDITGYWVSVVTEDWRYRMVTPKKGDYPSIPLNPAGRQVGGRWPTHGIPQKMKRRATSAKHTELQASSACEDACTSHGRMTTLFASTRRLEPKQGCFASAQYSLLNRRPGKVTRSLNGNSPVEGAEDRAAEP